MQQVKLQTEAGQEQLLFGGWYLRVKGRTAQLGEAADAEA